MYRISETGLGYTVISDSILLEFKEWFRLFTSSLELAKPSVCWLPELFEILPESKGSTVPPDGGRLSELPQQKIRSTS